MELILKRSYRPEGTNGHLYLDGKLICRTIELPWKDNQRNVSCIPEGAYVLTKRKTQKRGTHLIVQDVRSRTGLLIHAANDALKELKGCIAPVTQHIGDGTGILSKKALGKLERLVFAAMDQGQMVHLTIQEDTKISMVTRMKSPTPPFFNRLRNVGVGLAAVGSAILTAPVGVPAAISAIAGYLVAGGSVLSVVSQSVTSKERS